jgi:hypothetical protein
MGIIGFGISGMMALTRVPLHPDMITVFIKKLILQHRARV